MIALHQNCKIYKNLNKKSTERFGAPKNSGGPGQVPRLPMRKSGPVCFTFCIMLSKRAKKIYINVKFESVSKLNKMYSNT